MLTLLVMLVVLALIGWGARAVLAGMSAPAWLQTVVVVVLLIVAVVLVANAFGIATPALR
jgi:hypothetical protein